LDYKSAAAEMKVKAETPVAEVLDEPEPPVVQEVMPVATKTEKPTEAQAAVVVKRRRGPQPKSYCCDICGYSFSAGRDLRAHLRTHDECLLPSYECCECKRSFLWPSHLERHMRTHTGVRPFTCYVCDRQFAQVSCS